MIKLLLLLVFGFSSFYMGVVTSRNKENTKHTKVIDNLRLEIDQERFLNDRLQQENEMLRNHVLEVGRDLNKLEHMSHYLSPSCKRELSNLWYSK